MKAKKMLSASLAGAMSLGMAVPVLAATGLNGYDSVIDTTKTGSLTIQKILENDGWANNDADGHDNADANTRTPVDKIVFSYLKIADIVSVAGNDETGKSVVGIYFTNLNEAIFGTDSASIAKQALGSGYTGVKSTNITLDGETTASKYYTTQDVEDVMNAIVNAGGNIPGEVLLNNYLKQNGTAMTETDKNGVTSKDGLALGLYMVGETDISAHDGLQADGTQYKLQDGQHNPEELITYDASGSPVAYTNTVIDTLASPFLVSLPTTNIAEVGGNAPGTVWEYDLKVYPKNEQNSIVKRIVAQGDLNTEGVENALVTREDYEIGDVIKQDLIADVPVLYQGDYVTGDNGEIDPDHPADGLVSDYVDIEKKHHERYIITDKMSNSLSFISASPIVKIGPKAAALQENDADFASFTTLVKGTDYNVFYDANATGVVPSSDAKTFDVWAASHASDPTWTEAEINDIRNNSTFIIEFTPAGLAKLDTLGTPESFLPGVGNASVMVQFDSILNENAYIGVTGSDAANDAGQNVNYPSLAWKNTSNSMRRVEGNRVYDYTYELRLTKKGVDTAEMENVVFTIKRTDADETPVQLVKDADGRYHFYDKNLDAESDIVKVTINGTDYSNAASPAADGTLYIEGFDSEKYTFQEVSTQDHRNLLKSTFTVEFNSNGDVNTASDTEDIDVFVENTGSTDGMQLMTGALDPAELIIDGVKDNLNLNQDNAGIAEVTVNNYKTITLRTGGEGRTAMYVGSIAAMGILIGAAVYAKKRKENVQ